MKNILCFGDSNTYGYTPDTHQRFEENQRFSGILKENMKPYEFNIIEDGVCGRTTIFNDDCRSGRNGSEALPYALKNAYPLAYVILMLGTNDCKTKFHADAKTIAKGMEILINQIQIFDSCTKILVMSPILLEDGVWKDGYDPDFDKNSVFVSRKLKEEYKAVALKNGCLFLAAEDFAVADKCDCEHMNVSSHKILAKAVQQKILEDVNSEI